MLQYFRFRNRSLEKAFIRYYDEKTIPAIRLGFWIACLLYAVFGILDYFLMPLSYARIWFIRFGIVIPFIASTYLVTFIKPLRRYIQTSITVSSIVMGLGITAMMAIADNSEPGYRFYYAGMMLVIMGICSLFRLRFLYALFACTVIIAGYQYTAIYIQGLTRRGISDIHTIIFINNNFFFVSSNVIGLIAAYVLERFTRVEFFQQEDIADKHRNIIQLLDKMNRDLDLARQIQSRLLPETNPAYPGIRFSTFNKPMEALGGDFYDFIKFQEKNLIGIFISDVSGHGLPAALITAMLKTLNNTSGSLKLAPSEFLNYLNMHITGQIGDNFLTALYAVYDTPSRIMKYSRAGHPYPVLIRDGNIKDLVSHGGAIGLDPYMKYSEASILLEPGDKILLYTDGLIEECNASRQMFMDTYFNKVLPGLSFMKIDDVVSISYRRLIEFCGSENLADDICIVGFEVL